MTTLPNRRVLVVALAAGAALAVAWGVGAARSAHAEREAALEARVLDEDIAFLERRTAAQPGHHLLNGMLVDRYAERFQLSADIEDLRRATDVAGRLVADRPRDPDGWVRLARVLLTQHRFRDAHDAATRAVRLRPDDDAVIAAYVDAARAIGAYAAADSALARMSEGSIGRALRTWGSMVDAGAIPQARRLLRRACARFDELGRSRDVRAWCRVRLADAALAAGRRDEAERWLEEALRTQPAHRGALETLAGLALEDEDWAEAVRLLEMIAAPAHPDIYLTLARAHGALGSAAEAERAETRFLRLATAPDALDLNALFLARYYAAGGRDCGRADELIRREIRRRPSVEVRREAALVAEACGDGAAAPRFRARADAITAGRTGEARGGGS